MDKVSEKYYLCNQIPQPFPPFLPVRWLVREEDYFERRSGVSASFGEMLLLMAIHFHSHQLGPVCDLVCQTLGMKVAVRTNNLSRMKAIFTQVQKYCFY